MQTYEIDPVHSLVEFAVKHMKVSTVKGRFLGVEGRLHVDEGTPERSRVEVKVNAAAVDTGVAERDSHLRSADFLNASLFPEIRFRSTRVVTSGTGSDRWQVHGDLSLRGITREVVLNATLEGRMVDVDFTERIGFSAETQLDRRLFGINWEGVMGRFLVGDEIVVTINIEAKRIAGD